MSKSDLQNNTGSSNPIKIYIFIYKNRERSYNQLRDITVGSGATITVSNIDSLLSEEIQFYSQERADILFAKEKIQNLRMHMGFNISEIACILQVQRPAIYEWLELKEPNNKNQIRLDSIYKFCEAWRKTDLGSIERYIRKPIAEGKSLFDLLSEEILNDKLIFKFLDQIEYTILQKRKSAQISGAFNFKESSPEEKERTLIQITRTIG